MSHDQSLASPLRAVSRRPPPTETRVGIDEVRVVGIGASAGGLEACTRLVEALDGSETAAIILVQHLDPTHDSMMVELLATHTSMTVLQAADGMRLSPAHLYVIPPASFLSLRDGALAVSYPKARRGARLPFDFLLHSLAKEYGSRAVCVVLSGTGADGSLGLRSIRQAGGLVIAQDPDEAAYDGMPRNAIATGAVHLILPVAMIAGRLGAGEVGGRAEPVGACVRHSRPRDVSDIVELLRIRTVYDFTLYKRGTLQRRVERRMASAGVESGDLDRYFDLLERDADERDQLAKDLLINVTSFFRDSFVFAALSETVISDMVRLHASDQPLRLWVAGCSTGEETYSLAMIFQEQIAASGRQVRLQAFASDVDPDAVATAREGLYAGSIETDVSPARLARFFTKEGSDYRVSAELRAAIVFTVQNVLADPPFSRLDFVSCRNLLIYLTADAQAKVISLFHFALREGGVLLLGSAETIGNPEGRFEMISKAERIFRHTGRRQPGDLAFPTGVRDSLVRAPSGPVLPSSRAVVLAELGRRLVLEMYAPAAILIDARLESLFALGPIDEYLRVAPGHPTHDLLSMARPDLRGKLRQAIRQSTREKGLVTVPGGRVVRDGRATLFNIEVRPVASSGEELKLVCFIDVPASAPAAETTASPLPRVAELERDLDATRAELQVALQDLEMSTEEQEAINEEALSVNEEYQSTNEELLTSKEELQALNEELTALNSQIQETLERQRTMADDLQNVLYSTDVATLFLDRELRIRFFTPATRSLFSVIPSDVGRPLADLTSLASDNALSADLRAVLDGLPVVEREVETPDGVWYSRRVLPYRTHGDGVEGIVLTFTDVTERKHIKNALEAAKQQAEQANVAKSRFLAVASHDLRQPLQTLVLLQGLLEKAMEGEKARDLLARLDHTLGAMSGMLNSLLDINQIEAGIIRAEKADFAINALLSRLRDEFVYPARAQGLTLRVVACGLWIKSDPGLLEQMIRNLLSNALKYTRRGKVLLGCRRRGEALSIEIWDTGVGIPEGELDAIFKEYHQLDNPARERSRGLGLGLSIVQRLGDLLGHHIKVRSRRGMGSVFAVEVPLAAEIARPIPQDRTSLPGPETAHRSRTLLVVEDDPDLRGLLELFLHDENFRVVAVSDGVAALALIAQHELRPELLLSDYNLPNGLTGLDLAEKVRRTLGREIPVIVLTGDVSADTLRAVAIQRCMRMNKPVKLSDLRKAIEELLVSAVSDKTARRHPCPTPSAIVSAEAPTIFIVDDDIGIRDAASELLIANGHRAEAYESCEAFLDTYQPRRDACLLIDAYLPGMSGLALIEQLRAAGDLLPAIMITGDSDVPMAVHAMRAGASDFIEKPVGYQELLVSIRRALERAKDSSKLSDWREEATAHISGLTPRQREVMELVLAGHPSKNIAADLGISQRTVENHRASIMKRTGSASLPALARLALAAHWTGVDDPTASQSKTRRRHKQAST